MCYNTGFRFHTDGGIANIVVENVKGGAVYSGGARGTSSAAGLKSQYGPRYQDRRANEERLNIDALQEEREQETPANQSKARPSGMLPRGIDRLEHKDEEVKVATSAELQAEEQEDEDLFIDQPLGALRNATMLKDNEVWHAAPGQPVKVKPEPGTEEDAMDLDEVPVALKTPPSPELQKKVAFIDIDADGERAKALERKRAKALQDPELRALALDREALLHELNLTQPIEGEPGVDKDGRLYLFQFPPILPPLIRVSDENEVVDVEDGDEDGPKVKTEPGTTNAQQNGHLHTNPGGFIGKLNVRRSGKVELDWGGQMMDLGIATETEFLTTAIIVDEKENDMASGAGKATGMGKVYSKFIVVPRFDEEEDWNPSLEGLNLWV